MGEGIANNHLFVSYPQLNGERTGGVGSQESEKEEGKKAQVYKDSEPNSVEKV